MRIDLLYALINRSGAMSWTEVLTATRRHAAMAEDLGFDSIWLGEHHFDTDGTDACPNPVMLAADLAARTKTLRLGMAAVSLTLWHPLRAAEDLAMLDHFSDGRLDVAFGRGILPIEVINLNPTANRWEGQDVSREIFQENLEIVRKAWTEDPFSWDGKRHTFPTPGIKYMPAHNAPYHHEYANEDGDLVAFGLVPRPVQTPTPPTYAVTETMTGFVGAGRDDLGVITWYPTGQVLKNLFEAYQQELAKSTGKKLPLGDRCGVLRLALLARTDAEARRIAEPHIKSFFDFICKVRSLDVWLDADEDPNDPYIRNMDPWELLMERDHLLIGSPDTVYERMERMTKSHGLRHWLLQMGFPGIRNPELEESMRIFSREVLPAVRKL